MARLMHEIMEGWQEMEGKDKVVLWWIRHMRVEGHERSGEAV